MRFGCLLMLWLSAATALAVPPLCPPVPVEHYEPRTFLGYACRGDCDLHKAGFAWAVRWGVSDARVCDRLDGERAEGCRAHAEERLAPEQAGERWARENEVTERCFCEGAGAGFAAGCRRALELP
jgi:hypothetical protein